MAKRHKKLPLPEEWRRIPTQYFMSGVEGSTHFNIAKSAGARYMLMSYWHLRKKGSKKMMEERFGDGQIKLLIDSGAHTFMENRDEYVNKPDEFWEKYIQEYLEWAEKNKKYIMAIVELDLDLLFGVEKVQEWRNKYFEPFERRTGIPVCYVWRSNQPEKLWIEMCKRYRYVGFSGQNDEASVYQMKRLLRIAKKYGAVVHGFAMSKPSILPQLPFFSFDSISWKSGEMYGVTYIWDGRKFHTITKDKKEQARRRFKQKLLALGCNWDLYIKDDNNEVTRMNAIAWLEVTKYIQRRLKPKMYWLDKEALKRGEIPIGKIEPPKKIESKKEVDDEDGEDMPDEAEEASVELIQQDLADVEFPEPRWFKGAMRDLDEWCRKLNISPDYGGENEQLRVEALFDATILCTIARNEDTYIEVAAERYTHDRLRRLCIRYLGTEIRDDEIALEELTNFFVEVVTGKNDFFYTNDGNIDEAPPEPREREDYLVEEDTFNPVEKAVALLEEAGIPKARDHLGRFLPGQTAVRKPKKIYSDLYPKLACDTCYAAESCPKFRPGYLCAYNKLFERFNVRDPNDLLDMLYSAVELNGKRLQRAAIFEVLQSGAIDPTVTGLIQMQTNLVKQLLEIQRALNAPQASLTDPDVEVTIKARNGGRGTGILSQIFGMPGSSSDEKDEEEESIDAEFNVKEDEETTTETVTSQPAKQQYKPTIRKSIKITRPSKGQ